MDSSETWLTAAQVRARQGNISDMSLWRWTRDPNMRFPEPDDHRNRRKYWKLSTILKWEAERATKQAEPSPTKPPARRLSAGQAHAEAT